MRVLVVDDDESGRYLLETILRASGYAVEGAQDGEDALTRTRRERPDIIVTDVLMPKMDGYKLCLRLKGDDDFKQIPIIVYTASFGAPEDKQFALSLGVDSFILKPADPKILLAEIERLMTPGRHPVEAPPRSPKDVDTFEAYGERISHKLYEKLLQLEDANQQLAGAAQLLNVEIEAKSRLVDELTRSVEAERQSQSALRASQQRYEAAVQGAQDGVWDWDLETGAVYGSDRFREMLGIGKDAGLDSEHQWGERLLPEDAKRLDVAVDQHRQGLTHHLEVECRMSLEDGGVRWLLVRGQALRREDGTAYRMAGSLSDITERKQQQEELLHNALYDKLTGLANRQLLLDRIGFLGGRRARRPEHQFGLLCVGLDRFKNFNESLGRKAGDALLQEVGRRLVSCARDGDTVARLGGDEYAMLVDDLTDALELQMLSGNIQAALRAPFTFDGREVFPSASIGQASTLSGDMTAESMISTAEAAMHRAKQSGGGRTDVFDQGAHDKIMADLELEADFRRALERDEFEPYFQPVVSIETGRVTSFEALVRWNHPTRGLLPPAEFISLAEVTGLIVPMDLALMRAACTCTREWDDAGCPPISISVNVSARHFAEPDLLDSVQRVLDETGVSPGRIVLEVTEGVVMADPRTAVVTLGALTDLGLSIALDDFGTGYSSLSYLKAFPFTTLKIDRGFVGGIPDDPDDLSIVEAVIGLAHGMRLVVTAEGVETQEQLDCLRSLGCDQVQGFFLGRPVPAKECERFLTVEPMDFARDQAGAPAS